ncbi:MAG TPA: MmcQ/YjbR family DNA-binding protein [Pirellulales bacterium]|nr:MmcQ/YjbR family DNA-binding protein [Pirellulales bacterium]
MRRSQKSHTQRDHGGVSFDTVRAIARELPGAVERTSYGTPAFYVGKTLFARQHQDGKFLVIRMQPEQRALRVKADPETYFVTEHYVNYPLILVRMATIEQDELRDLITEAWRLAGGKPHSTRRRGP